MTTGVANCLTTGDTDHMDTTQHFTTTNRPAAGTRALWLNRFEVQVVRVTDVATVIRMADGTTDCTPHRKLRPLAAA